MSLLSECTIRANLLSRSKARRAGGALFFLSSTSVIALTDRGHTPNLPAVSFLSLITVYYEEVLYNKKTYTVPKISLPKAAKALNGYMHSPSLMTLINTYINDLRLERLRDCQGRDVDESIHSTLL